MEYLLRCCIIHRTFPFQICFSILSEFPFFHPTAMQGTTPLLNKNTTHKSNTHSRCDSHGHFVSSIPAEVFPPELIAKEMRRLNKNAIWQKDSLLSGHLCWSHIKDIFVLALQFQDINLLSDNIKYIKTIWGHMKPMLFPEYSV